jgi:DNA-binding transcriptional LysR family regulator
MDVEKCKILLQVIEDGSLTRTADKSGYTISGISRMVAAMEDEVGFPLLIRSKTGVQPTGECRKLIPVLNQLARTGDLFTQQVNDINGLLTGKITVGTSYDKFYPVLAHIIADFCRKYPAVTAVITDGTSSQLSHAVADLNADFCIVSRREGKYDWIPLMNNELLAWVPASHPAAAQGSIPITNFAKGGFIEIYPGLETDNSLMFKKHGITPEIRFTAGGTFAVHALVEAGLGISIVNSLHNDEIASGVKALHLSPREYVEIGIAVPDKDHISPVAKRFRDFAGKRLIAAAAEL